MKRSLFLPLSPSIWFEVTVAFPPTVISKPRASTLPLNLIVALSEPWVLLPSFYLSKPLRLKCRYYRDFQQWSRHIFKTIKRICLGDQSSQLQNQTVKMEIAFLLEIPFSLLPSPLNICRSPGSSREADTVSILQSIQKVGIHLTEALCADFVLFVSSFVTSRRWIFQCGWESAGK